MVVLEVLEGKADSSLTEEAMEDSSHFIQFRQSWCICPAAAGKVSGDPQLVVPCHLPCCHGELQP